MLIIGPFLEFTGFLTCIAIYLTVSGVILVVLTATMMEVSQKRVLVFQTIAIAFLLSRLILIPLGTYISAYIETEYILVASGILYLIAAIPVSIISCFQAFLAKTIL